MVEYGINSQDCYWSRFFHQALCKCVTFLSSAGGAWFRTVRKYAKGPHFGYLCLHWHTMSNTLIIHFFKLHFGFNLLKDCCSRSGISHRCLQSCILWYLSLKAAFLVPTSQKSVRGLKNPFSHASRTGWCSCRWSMHKMCASDSISHKKLSFLRPSWGIPKKVAHWMWAKL